MQMLEEASFAVLINVIFYNLLSIESLAIYSILLYNLYNFFFLPFHRIL